MLSADGQTAYVSNFGSDSISMYSVDSQSGALTSVGAGAFPSAPNTYSIASDPHGNYVYSVNLDTARLSAYAIQSESGALQAGQAAISVTTGTSPSSIAVARGD